MLKHAHATSMLAALCLVAACASPEAARWLPAENSSLPRYTAALMTDPVFTPPGFCKEAERAKASARLPGGLLLPPETYSAREIPMPDDTQWAGLFVASGSIGGLIDFVQDAWSAQGWKLVAGEREHDEAEGLYFSGTRYAGFRLGACTGPSTALLIVTGEIQ